MGVPTGRARARRRCGGVLALVLTEPSVVDVRTAAATEGKDRIIAPITALRDQIVLNVAPELVEIPLSPQIEADAAGGIHMFECRLTQLPAVK